MIEARIGIETPFNLSRFLPEALNLICKGRSPGSYPVAGLPIRQSTDSDSSGSNA